MLRKRLNEAEKQNQIQQEQIKQIAARLSELEKTVNQSVK